jgi:hypothetical protein
VGIFIPLLTDGVGFLSRPWSCGVSLDVFGVSVMRVPFVRRQLGWGLFEEGDMWDRYQLV